MSRGGSHRPRRISPNSNFPCDYKYLTGVWLENYSLPAGCSWGQVSDPPIPAALKVEADRGPTVFHRLLLRAVGSIEATGDIISQLREGDKISIGLEVGIP